MSYEKDPDEIGALWIKTSAKGTEYLSGTVDGVAVVAFRQTKRSDKSPDYRVMRSRTRDDRGTRDQRDRREAPRRASQVDDAEAGEW